MELESTTAPPPPLPPLRVRFETPGVTYVVGNLYTALREVAKSLHVERLSQIEIERDGRDEIGTRAKLTSRHATAACFVSCPMYVYDWRILLELETAPIGFHQAVDDLT